MMRKTTVLFAPMMMLGAAIAADRLYIGSDSSGDLANPANWDGDRLPDPKNDKAKFNSVDSSGSLSSIPL